MKRKDNKMVMEQKKHDNQKWNITSSPEFRIGDKSENGEQQNRTEQENNKMMYPNEEGQDEWGTQQERKSGGERSQELDPEQDMRSRDITGVTGGTGVGLVLRS